MMPSNPVDEAYDQWYLSVDGETPVSAFIAGAEWGREQERSRYEGLLARLVNEASFYRSCIASGERLNDEDNARWRELTLDGFGVWASNRAALTLSAPAEKEGATPLCDAEAGANSATDYQLWECRLPAGHSGEHKAISPSSASWTDASTFYPAEKEG